MAGDSDEEGSFLFGTALDPYDEDEVPKKKSTFQDITEQYAYDAQGRRRFHGAFTGGFSAGYFNSVALPEGWAPQTFKSSRSQRMQLSQKPEDFMDEEDRSEFGIAPREVHTTKEFSGSKRTKKKTFHDGPIPGEPVLQKLLEPVHETAAVRILKSMGWRPGYGIGERQTATQKKVTKKLYTCHIPVEFRGNVEETNEGEQEQIDVDDDSDEEEEDDYSKILFEPDDFEPFVVKPKTDSFGLGYSGLSRHSVLSNSKNEPKGDGWTGSHLVTNDKGRKVSIRGEAFGVGALEEDDDDIYAKEDLSTYDFTIDNPEKSKKTAKSSLSRRNILEGFIPAKNIHKPAKIYHPPSLPSNYVPNVSKVRKTRFSEAPPSSETNVENSIRDRTLGRHELTSTQRAIILGEKDHSSVVQSPTTDKSESSATSEIKKSYQERIAAVTGRNINFTSTANVIDADKNDGNKLSEKSTESTESPGAKKSYEDRLAAITGRNINFTSTTNDDKEKSDKDANDNKKTVTADDQSFKPFLLNPAKQARYEKFKIAKKDNAGFKYDDVLQPNEKLTEWEKSRELCEFEHAYKLYKPLTGSIGDRFTTAEHREDNALGITQKITSSSYVSKEKQEAAKLGMFGKKTREITDWKPDSILCKRFNIPEPNNAGYAFQDNEKTKPKYSIFQFLETPVHNKSSFLREQNKMKSFDVNAQKTDDTIVQTVNKNVQTIQKNQIVQTTVEKVVLLKETNETVSKSEPPKIMQRNEPKVEIKNDRNENAVRPKAKRMTVAELFLQEKEKEREAAMKSASGEKLQFQKELRGFVDDDDGQIAETIDNFNKIDLYRAIFLSESESDSDDGKQSETSAGNRVQPTPAERNVERNKSPPRGIFANLNLEKINSWREKYIRNPATLLDGNTNKPPEAPPKVENVVEKMDTSTPSLQKKKVEDNQDPDLYGPRLPEKFVGAKTSNSFDMESSSSSDSSDWVETNSVSSNKTKTEKSKNKKKKEKKKKSKSSKHHKHKSKKSKKKSSH